MFSSVVANQIWRATSTSTLALDYPLLGPLRHVRAYYRMSLSSPGFLCSDPFHHGKCGALRVRASSPPLFVVILRSSQPSHHDSRTNPALHL